MLAIVHKSTRTIRAIVEDEAAAKLHGMKGCILIDVPEGCHDKRLVLDASGTALSECLEPHWAALRAERCARLIASDPAMLPDHPMFGRSEVAAYRDALRSLPANTTDPRHPHWPEKPAGL